MSITAELRATLSASQVAPIVGGDTQFTVAIDHLLSFTDGIGANQADVLWSSGTRSLAASGTETIDVRGALSDAMGVVVDVVELVALLVVAAPANTNDVVVGNAANPIPLFSAPTATFAVKPGGVLMVGAPAAAGQCTIAAGSTDGLKITNSAAGTPVSYSIVVIGRTA
jgi:hypothetical protein